MNQLADYDMMVHDAFAYAKEGVYERTDRWVRLILGTILLGIPLSGYIIRIYRGATPAPAVEDWGALFIDGLKLMVIGLIYAIPVIIIALAPYFFRHATAMAPAPVGTVQPFDMGAAGQTVGLVFLSILIMVIVDIIIAILLPIASIRFARTRDFFEAFNFRAIIGHIGKIGWLTYILALIVLLLIIGLPLFIVEMIVIFVGFFVGHIFIALGLFLLLILIIAPLLSTFQARFMTRVYDLGTEVPADPVKVP